MNMDGVDRRQRFQALYAAHWQALFGYACRRADTVEDAADIVSEVFLVAWRQLDEVPAGSQARMWLFGVARLTLNNHQRGQRRRDRLGGALMTALRENYAEDPSDWMARSEAADKVRAALARLPDADRELICLVAWEELTPTQAARLLGINAAAARTRLSRARRRLRQELDDDATEINLVAADLRWKEQR